MALPEIRPDYDDEKISPLQSISNFLEQKSVLRSTHFMVVCKYFEPWQVEDFSISLPQPEVESVGYLDNLYTFPIYKNSEPVKLQLTIADTEYGKIFNTLTQLKDDVFNSYNENKKATDTMKNVRGMDRSQYANIGQGRYVAPSKQKKIEMIIDFYTPSGAKLLTSIKMTNMFLLSFDEIKYSYSSLTDYQKYNCTFICDPVNFEYFKNYST